MKKKCTDFFCSWTFLDRFMATEHSDLVPAESAMEFCNKMIKGNAPMVAEAASVPTPAVTPICEK